MPDPISSAITVAIFEAGIVGSLGAAIVAGQIITGLVTTFAISAVSSQFFRQKQPNISGLGEAGRTLTFRSAAGSRRLIYGETRVGGEIVFAEVTGDNEFLHMVIVLAGHEVEAIGDIYANDQLVTLDGSGNATGAFAGFLRVKKHLGADDQVADTDLVSEVTGWTTDHRLRSNAYIYVRLKASRDVYPTGVPNFSAVVKGRKVYDPRDGGQSATDPATWLWTDNAVLCQRDYLAGARLPDGAGGLSAELFGIGALDSEIDDTEVIAGANVCDEQVAAAAQAEIYTVDATADSVTLANARHWKTGAVVRVSSSGTLDSALSAGVDYYWRRLGASTGQLAASLANARAGTVIDLAGDGTGDQTATLQSEPRYTANGPVELDETPEQVMGNLLSATGGRAYWTGGTWVLAPAAYRSPTVTLDEDDLRGPIRMTARLSRRETFNRVKGLYVAPDNEYQPADFPAVTNATYLARDNGVPIWADIELPFTDSPRAAQRIAKVELERAAQQISVQMPCKLTALRVRVGDTVRVTNARRGWSSKEFEVTDWRLVNDDVDGVPYLGIDLELRETASAVYGWSNGEETAVDPAPDTTLPNPSVVAPPTGLTLSSGTAQLLTLGDGSVISRIQADWTAPADQFVVAGGRVELYARKSAEADYVFVTDVAGSETRAFIDGVEDGVSYDVRARSVNRLGAASDQLGETWPATVTGHVVIGKTAQPLKPDTFTVSRLADGTRQFDWTQAVVDADVRSGGGYLIRSFLGATSDWDAMTPMHTGKLVASPFETNQLAAGTYTFAIKTVDSSDNESADVLFISATLGNPRLENVLVERQDHLLGWPGVLTDCFKHPDNALYAVSAQTWADLPATWSALAASWESILTNASPIRYETETIDLGSDVTFTPLVTATGSGTFTFEMQTGTAAQGAPQAPWVALGQVSGARYVKVRASSAGTTPRLETLTTLIDSETQVDEFEDVDTSAETATWFNSIAAGHFQIGSSSGQMGSIAFARIEALQNVGAGFNWELINKTSTVNGEPAAEFKIYNGGGVLTDATVDVVLRGPKT